MLAVFVVGLVVVLLASVSLDDDGRRGILIGAGLGLLNLAVGYPVMRWALRRGMKTALTALSSGFIARLVLVAGLIVYFQRTGEADPTAFAITFLVFFFVYLGLELLLVERKPD
jgi:hypothetical protein